MAETFRTRHKISGVIDENTPEHIVNHPVLGQYFEIVGPEAKPYLPEMHRTSLPDNPSKDELEVARVAGFTNPEAFQNAVADAKARAKAQADTEAEADKNAAEARASNAKAPSTKDTK